MLLCNSSNREKEMAKRNCSTPANAVELYLKDFESFKATSAHVWCKEKGYSYTSLREKAKNAGIKLPSRSVCALDYIDWNDEVIGKLTGHLLGDGSLINPKKRKTSAFQLSCKNKEYLEWVVANSEFFKGQNVWSVETYDKRTKNTYSRYWCKTGVSHKLEELRQLWYPEGKKVLPEKFNLTKEGLLRFYLEDGCNTQKGGLSLSVHDFSLEDIIRIKEAIEQLVGIPNLTLHREGEKTVKIYISKYDEYKFLSFLGKRPVECFKYKFKTGYYVYIDTYI